MARMHVNFSSKSLDRTTEINIIKPDYMHPKKQVKLLYLLHGLTGDYSNMLVYTNIEKYVVTHNMIVVMPSAYNGFYTNTVYGVDYFDFITIELPTFIQSLFNLEQDPENTFIAGLSMGGYGALKAALTYPNNYKKAASFSGVLDIKSYVKNSVGKRGLNLKGIFGEEVSQQEDLFYLASKNKEIIKLYISCGKQDSLLKQNQKFHHHLKDINYVHTYEEPEGNHTWDYWDRELKKVLDFFLK